MQGLRARADSILRKVIQCELGLLFSELTKSKLHLLFEEMLFKLVTTGQKNDDEKSISKVRPKEEKAVDAAPGRGLGTFLFSICPVYAKILRTHGHVIMSEMFKFKAILIN